MLKYPKGWPTALVHFAMHSCERQLRTIAREIKVFDGASAAEVLAIANRFKTRRLRIRKKLK